MTIKYLNDVNKLENMVVDEDGIDFNKEGYVTVNGTEINVEDIVRIEE